MDLYREIDVRGVLPAIDVPTLVLHRRDDRMSRSARAATWPSAIPGARYVELRGADHLPIAGDHDALLDEVEEFLVGSRGAQRIRTGAGDGPLHRHRRLDRDGGASSATAAGAQLLERHDAAVRRQLALHRGREVKTMGDGFLATFDGPARAIRCAGAVQEELRTWGRGPGRHPHRRGRADRRRRRRHGGQHRRPHRRPRRPGEVLVSSTVRELVVGSGLEFADRGARTLKGAPGEWRLFAVDSAPR